MSELKIGIIGLDTSHVIAFTGLLNDPEHPGHIDGGKVVAAFPGGSPDMPLSRDRVEGYTNELKEKHNLEICPSINSLLSRVDAVLLESVDGRVHLKQFSEIAESKKPVFIDKPFTTSVADAKKLRDLAGKTGTPVFSSSSLRYDRNIYAESTSNEGGKVTGAQAYGPAGYVESVPGLFWYGIHSVEILFAMMGPGCERVYCIGNDTTDVVVGVWKDGRIGTVRGIREGKADFGCLVYREEAIRNVAATVDGTYYYDMVKNIIEFFRTGQSPLPVDETVEIMSFMEAANKSRSEGGKEFSIS
jgi:predicted dehydrogenase